MECQHSSGVCASHRHLRTSYIFILLMEKILNILMCETALLPIYLLFYAVFFWEIWVSPGKVFRTTSKVLRWYRLACRCFEVSKIYGESRKGGQLSTSQLKEQPTWANKQSQNGVFLMYWGHGIWNAPLHAVAPAVCAFCLPTKVPKGRPYRWSCGSVSNKNTVTPLSWDQPFATEFHHVAFGTRYLDGIHQHL